MQDRIPGRRRALVAMVAASASLAFPHGALAAVPGKRVGVFARASGLLDAWRQEFPAAFSSSGFVPGRNLEIKWYELGRVQPANLAPEEVAREIVGEMARASLDCVITHADPGTRYLQEALRTIPIVTDVPDPVAAGYAVSLSRPGGNITGLHQGGAEVSLKSIELLRTLMSNPPCVAWLGWSGFSEGMKSFETAARTLGVLARTFVVEEGTRGRKDLRGVFAALRQERCRAALVQVLHDESLEAIKALALEHRIALAAPSPQDTGVLIHYGIQRAPEHRSARRLPAIAARILRGESAGSIPFEGPTRYELYVNLKTANRIGVTFPSDVLVRADRVIQ